jgi:GDP-D-mannose 3', 5'-epimerase
MNHEITDIRLKRPYDLSAPRGVNGGNRENSMILGSWIVSDGSPLIWLRDGLEGAYRSMERDIAKEALKQEFELLEAPPELFGSAA